MHKNARALIIEDEETWQGICYRNLSKLVSNIDIANNLEEAANLIMKYYYHLAIIDLSLDPKDDENRDGMIALNIFKLLSGETSSIILSGTGRLEDGAKASKEGANQVMEKDKFNIARFIELSDKLVAKAMKNRDILKPGGITALIGSQEEKYIVHKIINLLIKPGEGGFEELSKLMSRLIDDYLPIWKVSSRDYPYIDEKNKRVNFIIWSRFVGSPFSLVLGRYDTLEIEAENSKRGERKVYDNLKSIEKSEKYKGIGGLIYSLEGYDILDFEIPQFLLKPRG